MDGRITMEVFDWNSSRGMSVPRLVRNGCKCVRRGIYIMETVICADNSNDVMETMICAYVSNGMNYCKIKWLIWTSRRSIGLRTMLHMFSDRELHRTENMWININILNYPPFTWRKHIRDNWMEFTNRPSCIWYKGFPLVMIEYQFLAGLAPWGQNLSN
jgi:hypothetical protein